jgi:antitoxin VapB
MLRHMPKEAQMSEVRTASLFRNGRNQAIRIPVEFELPGNEALIHKEGDRLIIEPKLETRKTLAEVLAEMEPVTEDEWPDITDDDLLPLDDIEV